MNSSQTTKTKFQYWKLSGRGQIIGILPLPEGHQPSYYVELETDKSGTVVTLREWLDQYEQPVERKPVFEKGRMMVSDYNNPVQGRKGRNVYQYDKRGMMSRRHDEDAQGNVRFHFDVKCDSNGRIVEESLWNATGRLIERREFEHDANGNETKNKLYTGTDGKTLMGFTTFAYDGHGNIIRRGWHDPKGKVNQVITYEYNENDRRTGIHMESDGKRTTSQLNEYDKWGRLVSTKYVNAKGETISRVVPGSTGDTLVHKMLNGVPEAELTEAERDVLYGKKDLADVLNVDKEKVAAMTTVAYSHLENGRFAQARALFEGVATLHPKDVYALSGVGAAALGQKEHKTALIWYDRALTHDPKHIPSLVGKGEALVRLNKVDVAMQTFTQLFSLKPPPNDPLVKRAQLMVLAISQAAKAG
jgi:hypothetical protein